MAVDSWLGIRVRSRYIGSLAASYAIGIFVSVCPASAQTTGQAKPPPRVTLNQPVTPRSVKAGHTAITPAVSGQAIANAARADTARPSFTDASFPAPVSQRTRIKDVASIEGIRDNQLIGYGIVVGLRGTGDTQQTVFPIQTLLSTLERMGITVPQTGNNSASNMQVKNMAGVFVEATLPPSVVRGTSSM
jgi:hypothetical protein